MTIVSVEITANDNLVSFAAVMVRHAKWGVMRCVTTQVVAARKTTLFFYKNVEFFD